MTYTSLYTVFYHCCAPLRDRRSYARSWELHNVHYLDIYRPIVSASSLRRSLKKMLNVPYVCL